MKLLVRKFEDEVSQCVRKFEDIYSTIGCDEYVDSLYVDDLACARDRRPTLRRTFLMFDADTCSIQCEVTPPPLWYSGLTCGTVTCTR